MLKCSGQHRRHPRWEPGGPFEAGNCAFNRSWSIPSSLEATGGCFRFFPKSAEIPQLLEISQQTLLSATGARVPIGSSNFAQRSIRRGPTRPSNFTRIGGGNLRMFPRERFPCFANRLQNERID